MWFFKNKPAKIQLNGFTDYHSHILPNVDDGVQTMEEAIDILHLYEMLGIKAVWLTPHIMEDAPNTTEHLRACFTELQTAYHGNIILHLASENMLDNLFDERLELNDLLPIGEKGDHILVETSYFYPPIGFYRTLAKIKGKGLFPILAHPERYIYMNQNEYCKLKEMGIKFQLNLPSLAGMYGKHIKTKAEFLKKIKFYDYVGTDIHQIKYLQQMIQTKIIE
jgi:protein-tyrosine phosphatase